MINYINMFCFVASMIGLVVYYITDKETTFIVALLFNLMGIVIYYGEQILSRLP